jgi:hypothetical protein
VTPYGTRTDTIIAIGFTKKDHPDRQLVLCRRDEEVGIHHAQLLSAGAGRDARCTARPTSARRKDKAAFDETARKLVRMFQENFVKFDQHVDADVRSAAPEVRIAAE